MLPIANTQLKVVRSEAEGMLEYTIASVPQRIMPSRMHATRLKVMNRFNARISLITKSRLPIRWNDFQRGGIESFLQHLLRVQDRQRR